MGGELVLAVVGKTMTRWPGRQVVVYGKVVSGSLWQIGRDGCLLVSRADEDFNHEKLGPGSWRPHNLACKIWLRYKVCFLPIRHFLFQSLEGYWSTRY